MTDELPHIAVLLGEHVVLYPNALLSFLIRQLTGTEQAGALRVANELCFGEIYEAETEPNGQLVHKDNQSAPTGWEPNTELQSLVFWDKLNPQQRYTIYAVCRFVELIRNRNG